jgi:phenylacetate-CoA ligase
MDIHAAIIRSALGPLWARWERSPYLHQHRELCRRQYDSPEIIRIRQWQALQDILKHAVETVPFYRDRWKQAGIRFPSAKSKKQRLAQSRHGAEGGAPCNFAALRETQPSDFDFGVSDFQRIPILTKSDIRANGRDLRSFSYDAAELITKKTSGSTGVSLEILLDDDSRQWKRACALRCDEWTGWRFGEPVAKVWGNPEFHSRGWRGRIRNVLLDRDFYLDTLHMDEPAMAHFARLILKKQPTLIFGHAHSVYLLAQYLKARASGGVASGELSESKSGDSRFATMRTTGNLHSVPLTYDGYRPKGIITTAMVLHSWQRRTIEQVFCCPVFNRYGCEEVSLIACECEKHNGMHVNTDGVFLEVLCPDENGGLTRPARPGESGSIIVTDLTNRAMPIIRYQVGDVAALSDRVCSCGRGLPLLERLEGREADYVVTPAGELISGISLTENFALHVPGVAQFQIIQETPRRFRFRIVRGSDFGNESRARLASLVADHFGSDVDYRCEYLDHIPSEPSGKYRFCISRVPNPFTRPQEVAAA